MTKKSRGLSSESEAHLAGASWAAGAGFPALLALAELNVNELAQRPSELRAALQVITDPHGLTGDAWDEIHLGTPHPSTGWMVHFWWGAVAEFQTTFDIGRADLKRRVKAGA